MSSCFHIKFNSQSSCFHLKFNSQALLMAWRLINTKTRRLLCMWFIPYIPSTENSSGKEKLPWRQIAAMILEKKLKSILFISQYLHTICFWGIYEHCWQVCLYLVAFKLHVVVEVSLSCSCGINAGVWLTTHEKETKGILRIHVVSLWLHAKSSQISM